MYNRMNSVYRIFLKCFLCSLFIPLFTLVVTYIFLTGKMYQETCEKHFEVLQSSADKLEKMFETLDEYTVFLTGNNDISDFYCTHGSLSQEESILTMVRAQEMLEYMQIANNYLSNIQLYSAYSDNIIDFNKKVLYLDRYYTENNFMISGTSYDQWRQKYLQSDYSAMLCRETVFMWGEEKEMLIYNKKFTPAFNRKYNNRIIFYMEVANIWSYFEGIDFSKSGGIFILDHDNIPILTDGENIAVQEISSYQTIENGHDIIYLKGRRMLYSSYKSNRGWRYVVVVPLQSVYKILNVTIRNVMAFIVIAFLSSLLIAFYMAKKLSWPIVRTRDILKMTEKSYSADDFIDEIARLVEGNKTLNREMEKQKKTLKELVLRNILLGNFQNNDDIEINARKNDINIHADYFILLVVVWDELDLNNSLEEISAMWIYFEDMVYNYLGDSVFKIEGFFQIDLEKSVILLSGKHTDKVEAMDHCEKCIKTVLTESNINFSISIAGDIVDNVYQLSKCFLTVSKMFAIPQDIYGNHDIRWYDIVKNHIQGKSEEEETLRLEEQENQEKLVRDIARYIEENYGDTMLSLTSIAEEFHFTTIYLSKLFKRIKGCNISKYIESTRMKHAMKMLESGVKINDIYGQVGYNSSQVFRRAWKRVYGTSPSEARDRK